MEVILLGIYAFFAWLVFFKFKLLPWNFMSQVVTVTIPIVGLIVLFLFLIGAITSQYSAGSTAK